jgi:molybdopterin converting factor subunit 1
MKCKIKAFGITREIIGQRELLLELPEGTTVGELKASLYGNYPRLEALKSLFIAINEVYAEEHMLVQENDEIALIPPVAGG